MNVESWAKSEGRTDLPSSIDDQPIEKGEERICSDGGTKANLTYHLQNRKLGGLDIAFGHQSLMSCV